MKSRHDLDALEILELAPHTRDAFANFQKISERSVAHHDNHLRAHHGDFAKEKKPTNSCLFQCRLTIARRATAVNIADDYVFALHAHRFNHLCKELTGTTDERFTLRVFVRAGRFAYEH